MRATSQEKLCSPKNKEKMSREQGTGNKLCRGRAWEVVYEPAPPEDAMKHARNAKFGLLAGFTIQHTEDEGHHLHCGFYFRDKPTDRKFTWGTKLYDYFTIGDVKPKLVKPLKSKAKDYKKKLQVYFDYCTDQEKHPGQIIGEPVLHKFKPKVCVDGIDLEKCKTKIYVFHHYKKGLSFREIFDGANETRQGEMMYDYTAIKKMMRNYDAFTTDLTVHHELTEFHEEPVKEILKDWDPAKESLILQGPSNAGKTELAKALAKHTAEMKGIKNSLPLLASNLNKLGVRDPHQPIIYDDMNFSEVSRSKGIALTDVENDRDIRILYGIHTIEAGTIRIFTTNEDLAELLPLFKDRHGAIERRFRCVNLTKFGQLYG